MSKISDEIRKVADEYDVLPLYKLADRIEAEHEQQLVEARAEGMQEGFAADKGPREFVELPKDADGVPIHAGDTVYLDDGRMAEVYSIEFKNGETNVLCRTPSGCYVSSGYVYRLPNKLTHTRPDSWGRIADELVRWAIDNLRYEFADAAQCAEEQANE